MTKKEFIQKYNGKQFKRTVLKGGTTEDIPAMRLELDELASEQGFTYREDDRGFNIQDDGVDTGQIFFKPVLHKEAIGTLTFRSADTVFTTNGKDVHGETLRANEIDGDSFIKDYGNIVYKYEGLDA